MTRLEDLQPTAAVRGILPEQVVTVVSVQWFGSEALELTYKGPSGRVANELLYRHDEPRLQVLEHGRPWSFDGDGHLFRVRFSTGDVLYGKMRPYLNKVWVAEFDGLCSAEFIVFPKRDGLNSQFLAARLNTEDFVTFANGQVSGERPRVDFEKLSRFPILLPPLPEQERIVAKLRATFSGVQRAETAARRAQKRLTRYRSAVLDAAVTGELTRSWRETKWKSKKADKKTGEALLHRLLAARCTRWEEAELHRLHAVGKAPKNDEWKIRYRQPVSPKTDALPKGPEGWTWITIDQLSWQSGYGTSTKCTYEGNGPPVLRIPNIRNRTIDFEDLKFAASFQDFNDKDFVAPGDLLLIRTNGSRDLIGRLAIVKTAPAKKCSFASYLIRFRLVGNETIWSWLSLASESNMLRSSIESRAATTAGQYNVSLSGLADLAIPLPPIDEQTEAVREVERRLSAADRLAAALEQQLARAGAARQSLLREAFSGHLVPQNAKDEPASILLERIHVEAEAQKLKGKGMKRSISKSKIERRPLVDVLRERKKPITPEELFRAAGFEPSQVDEFYRELSSMRDKLREQKPKASEAKAWPLRAHVFLQLKKGVQK
jgi:type I restriction enzyme S subunit